MGKPSLKLTLFVLLLLSSGSLWFTEMAQVEAARTKIHTRRTHHHHHRHHPHPRSRVNCSSDSHCDPFAKRIDWRCKYADVCQQKCNSFDGVFTCTDQPGYCICQMEN